VDLLADLNEPQRRAVQCIDGPLLVLAGAGSGKTRVITRRVAYLVRQGVAPWNVLAITFTNKAAGEMAHRVAQLGTGAGATICTFHSLCARLLREFADASGLSPNYTIYDRDDQLRVVKEAMGRLEMAPERLSPAAVHARISRAKNALKTARAFSDSADNFADRRVAEVYAEYDRLLAGNNAVDFDDLLLRMAFLLKDHPEIRRTLSERYHYVLVDEYQDTNHSQYILAHGIAGPHGNLCVTGDPDQSIYAWRGADIGNIMEFQADYPDATVIRLEENYRSTRAILAAASSLIAQNRRREPKDLWTRRAGGVNVSVIALDSERAEAAAVAQAVIRHRADGRELNDIAVFYRVNSLSRIIEETLFGAGIPYRVARGVAFYNRKEIKNVLAYLKVTANSADDLSCRRIINAPSRGIGAVTVKRLEAFAERRGISPLAACRDAARAGLGKAATRKVAAFAELIDAFIDRARSEPLGELVAHVAEASGIEATLKSAEDDPELQAWRNVGELITAAVQFEQLWAGPTTLEDFLHQVSLVSDVDKMEGPGGAVTLMTLHAAKGLEFPVVFIVGCEDGMLPFKRQQFASDTSGRDIRPDDLEEERRLAFVGMTRAKDDLTLMHVTRRFVRGRTTSQSPSRFLREIGDEFVDRTDARTSPSVRSRRGRRGGFYEDAYQREQIEALQDQADLDDAFAPAYDQDAGSDAPPVPPEYEHLRRGSLVYHPKFGRGTLTKIGSQSWPQTRVDVVFEDYGPKTLVLALSRLELA